MARLVDLEPVFETAKLAGFGTSANLLDFLRMQPVIDAVPREDYQKLLEFADDMASFFPACLDCDGKTPMGERTDKCVYTKLSQTDEEAVYCIKRGIRNIHNILEENSLLRTTMVSKGVYDQVARERDVAIDQLKSYGIGLGEKAKAKKVVEGYWIPIEADGYADGYPVWEIWECSICGNELNCDEDGLPDYCCDCGAEMSIPGPEYWEETDDGTQ